MFLDVSGPLYYSILQVVGIIEDHPRGLEPLFGDQVFPHILCFPYAVESVESKNSSNFLLMAELNIN